MHSPHLSSEPPQFHISAAPSQANSDNRHDVDFGQSLPEKRNSLTDTSTTASPPFSFDDSTQSSSSVFTKLRTHSVPPLNASSSTESPLDTWLHIERYLFATYTALQSGDQATLQPLKAPQSRMAWYAAVFNLCNGDPNISRDLYAKLALAILHTLETLVLYPMLRHADRGRLHVITGREEAPSTREAKGTARATSTTRSVSSGSFSFMRRLLFLGDPPASTVDSTPTSRRGEQHAPLSSPLLRFGDASGVVPPQQLRTPPLSVTVSPVASTAAAESKGGTDAAVLTPGGGADTERVQLDDEEQLLPEWSVTPSVLLTQQSSTATAGVRQSRETTAVMEGGIAEALSLPELYSPTPSPVSSSSPPATAGLPSSFCRTLIEEYANFMSFRRVVISCFSYLDQYYTRRFGMDTVSMMCLKIFYVVVYEPIRPLLLDEIIRLSLHLRTEHQRTGQYPSREEQLLQDTLGIIGELVAQVQATLSYLVAGDPNGQATSQVPRSLWRSAATPTGALALPRQGSEYGSCMEANAFWGGVPGTPTKSTLKLGSVGRGGGRSREAAEPSDMSRSASPLGRSREPSTGFEREASKAFITPVSMKPTMAAHPPLLVVDLRRIIEVSERLTSRSLAASMAQQALKHSEIKSRADSQATVQTGSIVVEVTQTLVVLVMTDVGDAYVAAAEEYYAHEVSRHLSTPWGRRHYVHWVRNVFQVERHLTQQLKFPSFQSALRTMLVRRLLTGVNRTIILDPDSGFLALLEVWSGSRQDDGLLQAVLEGNPPSTVAPLLPTTTGAGPENVKPLPPDGALGSFFTAFAETQDEACLLLLGSVLAAKVIQDCAQLVTTYLNVIGGTTGGGPAVAEPRRRPAGVPDPVDCVASPSLRAGRELMQQLLGVAAAYEALIMNHLQADVVLLNALRDALSEVLNPTRWSRPGAQAQTSSEQRARGGMVPHNDFPSVLLSRDAGAKATAPLVALAASIPDGAEVALHDLINDFCDIICLQDGAITTSVAAGGRSRASATMVDLESVLSQVATFASLLDNKDVFVEGFRVRLARRLIARHAEVGDVERSMVRRLQLQLGVGRTHAFELMLRDCDGTIQTREGFRETDAARRLGVDVRVQLLSSSHWPAYRTLSCQLHPSLAQGMDALQEYYLRQHPSRALQWIHLLSSASLRAEYPLGTKEVLASSVQATILLHVSEASNGVCVCRTKASANEVGPSATSSTLTGEHLSATPTALLWRGPGFHGATPVEPNASSHRRIYLSEEEELPSPASWPRGSITGAELAARMGMEFSALQSHLASVVRHKVFALVARLPSASPTLAVEAVAEETESPLHATNRFVLNGAFTHRAQRIRLPLPRSRLEAEQSGDASSAVPATVLDARHQQLDAAIIRIMKSSRLLRYHDLRVMAMQQVSGVFLPSTKVIKSRVEHLLSWGYLKRSDDDSSVLEYLA